MSTEVVGILDSKREPSYYLFDTELYVRNWRTGVCSWERYCNLKGHEADYQCYAFNKRFSKWGWKTFSVVANTYDKRVTDVYTLELEIGDERMVLHLPENQTVLVRFDDRNTWYSHYTIDKLLRHLVNNRPSNVTPFVSDCQCGLYGVNMAGSLLLTCATTCSANVVDVAEYASAMESDFPDAVKPARIVSIRHERFEEPEPLWGVIVDTEVGTMHYCAVRGASTPLNVGVAFGDCASLP